MRCSSSDRHVEAAPTRAVTQLLPSRGPVELELGDQATPLPAVVDRLIGFRLWPGGPGVDGFQARLEDLQRYSLSEDC
jgi:hypothetical protein